MGFVSIEMGKVDNAEILEETTKYIAEVYRV